jgi:hypothetical protein|tara:strand:+ start:454 stop:744 length:291 start_codon:yes stop_codon:yes gene_type:complete
MLWRRRCSAGALPGWAVVTLLATLSPRLALSLHFPSLAPKLGTELGLPTQSVDAALKLLKVGRVRGRERGDGQEAGTCPPIPQIRTATPLLTLSAE